MKMEELKFSRKMIFHMSMVNAHVLKYEYIITMPYNLLNGRKFYSETHTKKKVNGEFGKSSTIWYFEYEKETYQSLEQLFESLIKS